MYLLVSLSLSLSACFSVCLVTLAVCHRNCLFRALADQLEGDMSQHMRHRRKIVDYIIKHRRDFEPFVEDEVQFERYGKNDPPSIFLSIVHLSFSFVHSCQFKLFKYFNFFPVRNLGQNGTYGGNESLVAFARLHDVNIIIHQLNEPCWQVTGSASPSSPELHISYHNGDHYSSVRQIADPGIGPGMVQADERPVRRPARKPEGKHKDRLYCSSHVEAEIFDGDMIETVMAATQCTDSILIEQTLVDMGFDMDATISMVLQLMETQVLPFIPADSIQDKPGSSQEAEALALPVAAACAASEQTIKRAEPKAHTVKDSSQPLSESKSRSERVRERIQEEKKHVSNRQRKEKAKRERKERRMEEQRDRAKERSQPTNSGDNNLREMDRVTTNVGMLSI